MADALIGSAELIIGARIMGKSGIVSIDSSEIETTRSISIKFISRKHKVGERERKLDEEFSLQHTRKYSSNLNSIELVLKSHFSGFDR